MARLAQRGRGFPHCVGDEGTDNDCISGLNRADSTLVAYASQHGLGDSIPHSLSAGGLLVCHS